MPRYAVGRETHVTLQLTDTDGAPVGEPITLYMTGGNRRIRVGKDEVSNGETGDFAAYEPTLKDGQVTGTLKAPVNAAPQIVPGDFGTITITKDGVATWVQDGFIEELGDEWATNGGWSLPITFQPSGEPDITYDTGS